MMSNDTIPDRQVTMNPIWEALKHLVTDYHSHPLDFFNEHDVQAVLHGYLRREFEKCNIRLPASLCNVRKTPAYERSTYSPVKAEYSFDTQYSFGTEARPARGRFDLAILTGEQDQHATIWYQPVRVAIEIKLWTTVDGGGPRQDVAKLKNYHHAARAKGCNFTGLSLLFVHPGAERFLDMPVYGHLNTREPVHFFEEGVALQIITPESWEQVDVGGWVSECDLERSR